MFELINFYNRKEYWAFKNDLMTNLNNDYTFFLEILPKELSVQLFVRKISFLQSQLNSFRFNSMNTDP